MVSITILVIENEDFVRENILELLEAEGFKAIGANNGREGMALAGRHRPQLILCDVIMPNYSGYEVLEALRCHNKLAHTPFVFMSAKAAPDDAERGLAAGANYYLTKPFSLQELLDVIGRVVQPGEQRRTG
jgi:diguanylate cyclase